MKWEDVGGLEDVKKSILDTVQVGLFSSLTVLIVIFCSRSFYSSVKSPMGTELLCLGTRLLTS